jgi:predicted ArsR family transcriptional regulator
MGKDVTGHTRKRILTLLKQLGPTDSSLLAEQLGISAMAVRQHLYGLQSEGIVTYTEEARCMGRPAKLWQLTEAAACYFPQAYAELTLDLIEAVKQAFGEDGLQQLLEVRTQQQIQDYQAQIPLAGSLQSRVNGLAAIRTQEGYMAEVQIAEDGTLLLIENHCPICVAARNCTGICTQELQVFQAVLGAQVQVERAEHLLQGDRRCVYQIRF